jgi:hypothetical protein
VLPEASKSWIMQMSERGRDERWTHSYFSGFPGREEDDVSLG